MDILDIFLDILLKPPQPLMGLFFSYNIHDEERKEIFTILHCHQASSFQVTVPLFVPLFL